MQLKSIACRFKLQSSSAAWIGGRKNMEDRVLRLPDVPFPSFLALDGVGGRFAGEVASEELEKILVSDLQPGGRLHQLLGKIIALGDTEFQSLLTLDRVTNRDDFRQWLLQIADDLKNRLAAEFILEANTTMTVVCFFERQQVPYQITLWSGNSRVYRLGKTEVKAQALISDHSFVQHQLIQGGISISEIFTHKKRSTITACLPECPELGVHVHPVRVGDRYLVTTDGLTDLHAHEPLRSAEDSEDYYIQQTVTDLLRDPEVTDAESLLARHRDLCAKHLPPEVFAKADNHGVGLIDVLEDPEWDQPKP